MFKRVLQLTAPGKFDIVRREIAPLREGDVLVEAEMVTTCPQWDMHLWKGERMFPGMALNYPLVPGIPGHELVGRVIDAGPNAGGIKTGQRVAAWRSQSMELDGCYGTHVAHAAEKLLPIPDGDAPTSWASLELAMCVCVLFDELQRHSFFPCERFGVTGLGPSGLLAIQVARALGVKETYGFDTQESRHALARTLGCTNTMDPRSGKLPGRHDQAALDVSMECVGHPAAFEFLADHTRNVVSLFGVQRQDYVFKTNYWAGPPLRVWGYPSHNRPAGEMAHRLISEGKLDLRPLATETLPLSKYDKAVELLLNQRAIKVALKCDAASV